MDGPAAVRVLRDPRCLSQVLWKDWLTSPGVIQLNRRMLGADVHVMGTSFFTKAPRLGEATPAHQDLFLWSQTPATLHTRAAKARHLSTWVALERVDRGNGCLHMATGSHAASEKHSSRAPRSAYSPPSTHRSCAASISDGAASARSACSDAPPRASSRSESSTRRAR